MKYLALLALAAILSSGAALAQQPPGPPSDEMFTKMAQIRTDARTQMLGALTAEHRQLLATIAGNLAIATNPDYTAAAKQLDSALSQSEKDAITKAAKTEWDKSRSMMESSMPPTADGPGRSVYMRDGHMAKIGDASAGETLLHMAMGFGPMNLAIRTMGMHP